MRTARRLIASALSAAGLWAAGCASTDPAGLHDGLYGGLHEDLRSDLEGAPAGSLPEQPARAGDQGAHLTLRAGELIEAAVRVDPSDLPRAVRTAADAIAPGGTRSAARLLGSDERYRVRIDLGPDAPGRYREALLAADGKVLERSHSIPPDELPEPVEQRLRAARPGQMLRVDVVQRDPGEESYRAWIRGPEANGSATWLVSGGLADAPTTAARILDATVVLRDPEHAP